MVRLHLLGFCFAKIRNFVGYLLLYGCNISKACGNSELETDLGEDCEIGTQGCDENCSCSTGYLVTTLGCTLKASDSVSTRNIIIACVVSIGFAVAILFLLVGLYLGNKISKRKLAQGGYIRFSDLQRSSGFRLFIFSKFSIKSSGNSSQSMTQPFHARFLRVSSTSAPKTNCFK